MFSDTDGDTLKRDMEKKIINLAVEHAPELLEGKKPAAMLSNKAASEAVKNMRLPSERVGKLSGEQMETRRITGKAKFINKVHPSVTLPCHSLSCVAAWPPQEAYGLSRGEQGDVDESDPTSPS